MARLVATTRVHCRLDELAELLSHRPAGWLRPFLRIACHEGEALATRLEARLGPARLAKRVVVDLGPRVKQDGSIIVPLHWHADGYRALFPEFEGRFVLRPLGRNLSEVTLDGTYDPPGGVIGDLVDRLIAHRAAERFAVTLLENLRAAVEAREGEARAEGAERRRRPLFQHPPSLFAPLRADARAPCRVATRLR